MKREPLTLPGAHKRLEAAASADDPIWLMIGGEPQSETTVARIHYDAVIKRGCQDMAVNLPIRFWGTPRSRSRPGSPYVINGLDLDRCLLEGSLLDMVREREGRGHAAVPVADLQRKASPTEPTYNGQPMRLPSGAAGRARGVKATNAELDPASTEAMVAKLRSDILMVRGRRVLGRRYVQLALTALEQAEIWLAMAAEKE